MGESVKVVQVFLSYINLIFMLFIVEVCFKIDGSREYFVYSTALFAVGILVYIVLSKVFEKKGLLLTIILFICFIAMIFMGIDVSIHGDTINNVLIENPKDIINLYFNSSYIDVSLILPYMMVLIPNISIVYTHNAFKGRNFISVIINIILMTVFWFWHYEVILEQYIYIYCCIGIFSFMFDGYYRVLKGCKVSLNRRIISFVSFFVISLFSSGLAYEVVINVSEYHSGIYSDLIYTKLNGFDDGKFINSSGESHMFTGIDSTTDGSKEKIGGSLSVDNTPQFEVKAKRPVYLKASVKNKYDDNTDIWDNDYEKLVKIPQKEFIYDNKYVKGDKYFAEKKLYSTLKKQNVNKSKLEIVYDKSMLFHPYLTYAINNIDTYLSPENCIFKDDDSESYNISYYDYGEDMTLDSAHKYGQGQGKIFKDDNGKTTFSDKEYKEYEKYDIQFISGYSNVDDRVVKLVKKIVKGSKSDTEKAYRIEQYLKNNYTYSLKVNGTGRNLLYNFLFNEKKGYCVYFATAMTVMCKIANVPARYVEGVKMINRRNSNGNFVVTNADAHAWTEVLINPEFNTWYIADATPSAAQYIYQNAENNKNTQNLDNEKTKQTSSVQKQQSSEKSTVKNINIKKEKKPAAVQKINSIKKKTNYNIGILVIVIVFCVILLLRALYKIIIMRLALNHKGTVKLYNYFQKRLKAIGIYKPLNIGEIEFAESISDKEIRSIVRCIAVMVYSEYYGNETEDKLDKKALYYKFESLMRKRQGRAKYYFFKYLA